MKRKVPDKYGRGSAAANGAGFVDLAPGDTFDGLEKYLRARIAEVYENRTLGISASIGSKRNANELAKHRAPGESEEVHKFAAKNVGVLFERGQLGIRHFDKKAMPGQRWIVHFIRVFAPFVFDEERMLATITLKENEIGGNFYSVEAVDITKDAWPERTPRGAIPEGLNAAPLLDLASLTENIVAYYVGDCNRTKPEFVNRSEPFTLPRAAELLVTLCDPLRLCASALKSHPDASPVHDWLAQARNLGYTLTNLFPDDRKIADWLRRDAVVAVSGYDGCRLLIVHECGFDRLYFCTNDIGAAARACAQYQDSHGQPCVLDYVGMAQAQQAATAAFVQNGFKTLKTLTRLSRRGEVVEEPLESEGCRQAQVDDADQIYGLLQSYFNPFAEQLPTRGMVAELCNTGFSFVVCNDGLIKAFLLGEGQGKKSVVRYWFSMPDSRDAGCGGKVMRKYFARCAEMGIAVQELWVIDTNGNAIKRYEHYGFKPGLLKDSVFIKGKEVCA